LRANGDPADGNLLCQVTTKYQGNLPAPHRGLPHQASAERDSFKDGEAFLTAALGHEFTCTFHTGPVSPAYASMLSVRRLLLTNHMPTYVAALLVLCAALLVCVRLDFACKSPASSESCVLRKEPKEAGSSQVLAFSVLCGERAGPAWSHCVNTRVVLEQTAHSRILTLAKSPIAPVIQICFDITVR
jgi:hypothetical protein